MTKPEVVPRVAATVMLLRDAPEGMEVFMVVRHHEIDFASGAIVFPGGSVDPGDAEIAARADRCPPVPGLDPLAMACRVAAIREVYEECGVLLARARGTSSLLDAPGLEAIDRKHRAALVGGAIGFADMIEIENLSLAVDLLIPFAHWITPRTQPKRFDTHFFVVRAPVDQLALHDGSESVDSVWINPGVAIAEGEAGRYKLIFPTKMNLTKLGQSRDVAAALAAARDSRIVTVQPEAVETPDGRMLRLPVEAGYGGDLFRATVPSSR